MKKYLFRVILSAAKNLALMGLVVGFFACGDDSNSTSASAENGSLSSAVEDDESSSSINGDSSSVISGSSSSVVSDSEGSSSSVKGSDTADVSSSSGIPDPDRESSSSSVKSSSSSAKSSSSVNSSSSVKSNSSSSVKQSSSSSNVVQSSSSRANPWGTDNKWQPFNLASFEYGIYTDTREPENIRDYHYLTIYNKDHSDSLTVFAENLNIGEMVDGSENQSDNSKIERYCYDNDTLLCHYYGGLYQWAEMMNFNDSCNTRSCAHLIEENHRGICPEGWRLMTYDDYKFVAQSENVIHTSYEDMRSSFGFLGHNTTGFSLVPTGYIWMYEFKNFKEAVYWHYPAESVKFDTQTYSKSGRASMSGGDLNVQNTKKTYGFTVRCAKVE